VNLNSLANKPLLLEYIVSKLKSFNFWFLDLIYEFEINDLGNIEEELYENAQKIISLSDSSLISWST
jgi:predicted nucleotidyltransferase